jgi:hypothetical protein
VLFTSADAGQHIATAIEQAGDAQKRERRQRKREQIGSGGSTRGSTLGAAAAQEGANWERRQRKKAQKRERGEDFRSVSHVSYLFQRVF